MIFTITRRFLPLAFIATVLCGLVYLAVQQSLRHGANDPQIQMAEDAAAELGMGISTQAVVPSGTVDVTQSLAPYLVIFDDSGHPIAGNGILEGALLHLPSGVFDYVRNVGEDRFTWQPRPDVRSAVVLVRVHKSSTGFVMVGRSLREVEIREDQAELEAAAAWIFLIIGIFILEGIAAFWEKKK